MPWLCLLSEIHSSFHRDGEKNYEGFGIEAGAN